MDEYRWNVGIDSGSQTHEVCVVNPQGEATPPFTVAHTNEGIEALLTRLENLAGGDLSQVAVGIETPRGVVVDALVKRGAHVYAINPKQADRFRDRISPAEAKDDSRDSFVLGVSLRTDRHCFRRVEIDSPEEIELREMGRVDDELGEDRGRIINRLREQLNRYWPGVLALCPAADEPWFWALLARASEPAAARRLTRAAVANVLKEKRIRRLTADEVLSAFRAPALPVAPGTVEAVAIRVQLLVEQLQLVHRQRRSIESRLKAGLERLQATEAPDDGKHTDVEIVRSLPGVGLRVASALLGEAAQFLARRDHKALRNHAGLAPITRQSGKSRRVVMRRAATAVCETPCTTGPA